MNILAFETSTSMASVALCQNGAVIAEFCSEKQKNHSEVINNYTQKCLLSAGLSLEQIDVFAAGCGPGSFTGLRVATNTVKSFAYALQKPVVALDSLYLLACQVPPQKEPVLSIINAYKNMVYLGLFDVSHDLPVYIEGPTAVPVIELIKHIKQKTLVIGDGYLDYHPFFPSELASLLYRQSQLNDYPQAQVLAKVSHALAEKKQTIDWNSLQPLYIRASEAEESKRGVLIKPLR